MTPAEIATLRRSAASVKDLADRTARTLLFGYTTDKHTWHVYLDAQGVIHRVVYAYAHPQPLLVSASSGETGGCTRNSEYVPNKRLYPESCDAEFCKLLSDAGVDLPFTSHDASLHARRVAAHHGFAGHIREDLEDREATFIRYADVHPRLSGPVAQRCLDQTFQEFKLRGRTDYEGVHIACEDVAAMRAALDGWEKDFARHGQPPVTGDAALNNVRWLLRELGVYSDDAACPSETYVFGGTVKATVRPGRTFVDTDFASLDATASAPCRLEPIGSEGWRYEGSAGEPDFALIRALKFDEASRMMVPSTTDYVLFWRNFGSQPLFEAQLQKHCAAFTR